MYRNERREKLFSKFEVSVFVEPRFQQPLLTMSETIPTLRGRFRPELLLRFGVVSVLGAVVFIVF